MLLSNLNFKNENFLNIISKIDQSNFKIIKKKKIISKRCLKNNDFEFDKLYNENDIFNQIIKRLNKINKSSMKFDFKNIFIYQILIFQIKFEDSYIYYFKYKQIKKNLNLYLKINNKIISKKLKKYKNLLKKISNHEEFFKYYVINEKNYHYKQTLKDFYQIVIYYIRIKKNVSNLNKIMENLKSKNEKLNNKSYSTFLSILDKNLYNTDDKDITTSIENNNGFYNKSK